MHRIERARFEKNGVTDRGIAQIDKDVDALGRRYERLIASTRSCEQAIIGAYDAFVTKLNPMGSGLVYSTYLGGSGFDKGQSITVDPSGNAYVTGLTDSGVPMAEWERATLS